nr:hypothetical protein BaRGS_004115 [Batillaria attramentaria]
MYGRASTARLDADVAQCLIELLDSRTGHFTTDVGKLEINMMKNRYPAILPYDHTRVKLFTRGHQNQDYINASYISTTVDRYWPTQMDSPSQYGEVTIKMTSCSVLPSHTVRKITARMIGEEKQEVTQFELTGWRGHKCTLALEDVADMVQTVARTASFIALDMLNQFVEEHELSAEVNVFRVLYNMMKCRPHLIQSEDQYIFIHDVLSVIISRKMQDGRGKGKVYQNLGYTDNVYDSTGMYSTMCTVDNANVYFVLDLSENARRESTTGGNFQRDMTDYNLLRDSLRNFALDSRLARYLASTANLRVGFISYTGFENATRVQATVTGGLDSLNSMITNVIDNTNGNIPDRILTKDGTQTGGSWTNNGLEKLVEEIQSGALDGFPSGADNWVFLISAQGSFRRAKRDRARDAANELKAAGFRIFVTGLVMDNDEFNVDVVELGDVELNPGPPKSVEKTIQTRLTTERKNSETGEPSLGDVMAKLGSMEISIDSKLDSLRSEVNDTCTTLKSDMNDLKEEVLNLKARNEELLQENLDLRDRLHEMDSKIDDLENRSRRNNLLFYGISRPENETNEECEKAVQDFLTDKLELEEPVSFDRVHRLGGRADSPIIARCTFFKEKMTILGAKKKLQGSKLSVGEDFSPRVRSIRKALSPFLKEAKQAQKRAVMVFDHLLIDGRKYVLNDDRTGIREAGRHADQ